MNLGGCKATDAELDIFEWEAQESVEFRREAFAEVEALTNLLESDPGEYCERKKNFRRQPLRLEAALDRALVERKSLPPWVPPLLREDELLPKEAFAIVQRPQGS